MVEIYTKNDCMYCKVLKQYLVINDIEFKELNINDAAMDIQEIGYVPVIKIGADIITGFNVDEVNYKLNINNHNRGTAYLDNAASTKLNDDVLSSMMPYLTNKFANPSASYSLGFENQEVVRYCRNHVAEALKCSSGEIIFTSGGTESNNMAIKGVAFANKNRGNHIITSKVEHSSVLNTCKFLEKEGFEVTYLSVDKYGRISMEELERAITPKTILISIMYVNNEIGTIQDIERIGRIAKSNSVYLHTDAVQAIGKVDIDLSRLGIDLMSISAHKFHGPKGCGAMYVRDGIKIEPLLHGGGQESQLRSGTENIAGIVGLTEAIKMAVSDIVNKNLRIQRLESKIVFELSKRNYQIKINGHPTRRVSGVMSITFGDIDVFDGVAIKFLLDVNNIYVSSSSACNEASGLTSYVLESIGLNEHEASKTLRISIDSTTSESEIDYFIKKFDYIISKLNEFKG